MTTLMENLRLESRLSLVERRTFPRTDTDVDLFLEGDFAELDTTTGTKVKLNGASVPLIAYLVFRGTQHPDAQEVGPVVIIGPSGIKFSTKRFNDVAGAFAVGDDLTVKNGVLIGASEGEKVFAKVLTPKAKHELGTSWVRVQLAAIA